MEAIKIKLNSLLFQFIQKDIEKNIMAIINFSFNSKKYEISL